MSRTSFPLVRLALAVVAVAAGISQAQVCVDVRTFAGSGIGDGGPATQALLSGPRNAVVDASGNIFIADSLNQRVRKVDAATGTITTIAGNGAPGRAQDGDVALLASLDEPSGLALDGAGNVYIADRLNNTVWQLTADGRLLRVAGSGVQSGSIDGDHPGSPGNNPTDDLNDGQLATFATLNGPTRVAVDATGNVFISDTGNNRVREVDASTKRIATVAGTGVAGPGVDGPATSSPLNRPIGLAFAPDGSLYIADTGNNQIRKLAGGTLTLVAGNGQAGPGGNGQPALSASFSAAAEIAVDPTTGDVFIADTNDNQIRVLSAANGTVNAVAGDGNLGFRDNVPGFSAEFRHPGVALAPGGKLIIVDTDNNRLRQYDRTADLVTTLAGTDNLPGDGGPAVNAILNRPTGVAADAAGNVFISEHDSHRVRKVDANGVITTVVNQQGNNAAPADGSSAINAGLQQPTGIALDASNNLYIADALGHQVYVVDAGGVLHFLAGNGTACPSPQSACGDNGPATNAMLNTPLRVAFAPDGSLYVADFNDNRIRRIDAGGTITTVAGTGAPGSGGDGGPAASAAFNQPSGVAFDAAGNLFIADFGNNRVRRVDTAGTVTTVAGTGVAGSLGDGGNGATAQLNAPTDLVFMADGSLLIVDQNNNKIRRMAPGSDGTVSSASTITTIIGDGRFAFADGPGPRASLLKPTDVDVDAAGNILIADRGNQRVRIAAAGTDCSGTGGGGGTGCQTNADCDDGNACTVDLCQAGVCQSQSIGTGDCQPTCSTQPNGCIPGGGPQKTDCLAEALVEAPLTLRGSRPAPLVRCHRGDPQCDHGTATDSCTFLVSWCLNDTDSRLSCTSTGVTKLRAPAFLLSAVAKLANVPSASGTLTFSAPFTTADACTELMPVTVALRRGGRKAGKTQITAVAIGTGRRQKDVDKIRLVCLP